GGTRLLVQDDVAALGAEGDLDRVRELVDTALERATCVLVVDDLFSHRGQASMIARMSREPSTRYSSSPYFRSVPTYLENTTLSATGMRSPLSSKRPAPTATTSPSWGFSLAVSGMTRPEAVVCSASSGLTTTRSSRGLMETDMRLSLLHEEMTLREYLGSGIPVLVVVAVPTGGEIPSDSFWHSRPSTANDANSRTATGTR